MLVVTQLLTSASTAIQMKVITTWLELERVLTMIFNRKKTVSILITCEQYFRMLFPIFPWFFKQNTDLNYRNNKLLPALIDQKGNARRRERDLPQDFSYKLDKAVSVDRRDDNGYGGWWEHFGEPRFSRLE